MNAQDDIYAFVFKGQLGQDAADRQLETHNEPPKETADKIALRMPQELLHRDHIANANKMAPVYVTIAAFENSVRKFISDRMLENVGPDWWNTHVSAAIKKESEQRKKDEDQIRWHGARGSSMIYYTQIMDLVSIMQQNAMLFESHIESIDWARQLFRSLERSRNVIMHSGELSIADIERVGMNIRDWLRQVGG